MKSVSICFGILRVSLLFCDLTQKLAQNRKRVEMNSEYVENRVNTFVFVLHSLSNIQFTFIYFSFVINSHSFFQLTGCTLVLISPCLQQ